MSKRVVVCGAGPAGGAAAMQLAGAGIETILLDRKSLPRTKACGSGLSPWTLEFIDEIGVGPQIRAQAYRIDGALIAGTETKGIELRGDHETAILIRSELDMRIAEEAVRRGADLRDKVKVSGLERHGETIAVSTSEGVIEADAVIDATGATGRLTDKSRPIKRLHTIMGWWENLSQQSDIVELYFDSSVKPHYGWVFPESATRCNIGIVFDPETGDANAKERFDEFLERCLGNRLRSADQIDRLVGHPVSASTMPRKIAPEERILCAGEAGAMADAATAEGIFHALVSGTFAGQELAEGLIEGRSMKKIGRRYTLRTQRRLAHRMAGGRALMEALRTPVLDWALKMSDRPATRTVLQKAFVGLYHG